MTRYHGRSQYLLLTSPANGTANYNMQGYLIEADIPLEQDLSDITTAGSVGHKWYPGLAKSAGSFKVMFDDDTNATFNSFINSFTLQATHAANSFIANYGPGGSGTGAPKFLFSFKVKSISLPVRVADVTTATISFESENGYTVSTYG